MKLIKSSYQIEDMKEGYTILKSLEYLGKNCYKSEDRITPETAVRFMKMIVHEKKHYSVLRHEKATARLICSRSVSHQIVRHGLASFLQESQRYCNYSKKNDGEVIFIIPFFLEAVIPEGIFHNEGEISINPPSDGARVWLRQMFQAEKA